MPPMSTATFRFFKQLSFAYWIEMLAQRAPLVKSSAAPSCASSICGAHANAKMAAAASVPENRNVRPPHIDFSSSDLLFSGRIG